VRIVLDTNVIISGVFFGGIPGQILSAWNAGELSIVLSAPILAEYREVGAEFTAKYGGTGFEAFAALLVMRSEVVDAPEYLPEPVCADSADDKFLACALAGSAAVILSGDKHLLQVTGWHGIEILRPRAFLEAHIGE
jgi:putative PIN family toxin of toxin-antitoxin system